jgi:hypothetical protein
VRDDEVERAGHLRAGREEIRLDQRQVMQREVGAAGLGDPDRVS